MLNISVRSTVPQVDELIKYFKEHDNKTDSHLLLACLILIKNRKLRSHFMNRIDRPDVFEKIAELKRQFAESYRHELWCLLNRYGIRTYEFGDIVSYILKTYTTHLIKIKSDFVIISENRLKDFPYWYIIKNNNYKFTIKHIVNKDYKPKPKVKRKRRTNNKDYQPTKARIIYTPMGGQNKRR